MTRINTVTRRKVLGGIVASSVASLGGCAAFEESNEGPEDTEGFERVTVEGTELILEFEDGHPFDGVTVVQPDGELFVERELATGVSRETVELGVDYVPGEYEVTGSSEGTEQSSSTIEIRPDTQITGLLLGRNHPDEMYEGASERTIQTEVILTLENTGSGPDTASGLVFRGNVPRPTPDDYDESGIYDTESDLGGHADQIGLPPGGSVTIYSHSTPFNPASDNVSCSPDTERGEFEVVIRTAIQGPNPSQQYSVAYTGEDLVECEIEVEVIQ